MSISRDRNQPPAQLLIPYVTHARLHFLLCAHLFGHTAVWHLDTIRVLTHHKGGEQDSFQDAVDNADSSADTVDAVSVRSLTKRSVSVAATRDPPPHSENSSEGKEDVNVKTKEEDSDKDKAIEPAKPESRPESLRPSSVLSNRISHTSNLDNVNLDDDNSTKAEGTWADPSRANVVD